ncbi:LON peptidase substrate-binding domain-containing protein [Saccharomonospora sp. NPDC046836]|uniref:LON peptidase substrate-binding domain-containing protein n=1 Tax=Saccharomonospora sp. NPDC046836 TaxID=3156921 RepID=UPI003407EDC5
MRTTLPLFPLQTVLLPGAHLPLHIFEPRYRQLTIDLVNETLPDHLFGVIAIRTPLVREVDTVEHLHPVGCAARLRQAKRLPDGRFDIVTTGHRRFRLLDLDAQSAPYLLGTIEWLDDLPLPEASEEPTARLSELAIGAYRRYGEVAWEQEGWRAPPPESTTGELAYLLAADCLLPLADRQALLEDRHPLRRLSTVCRLLYREAGLLAALRAVPAPIVEINSDARPSLN